MLALLLLGFLSGVAFMLALLLVVILYLTNIYQGTSLPNPVKTEEFTPSQIPKVCVSTRLIPTHYSIICYYMYIK